MHQNMNFPQTQNFSNNQSSVTNERVQMNGSRLEEEKKESDEEGEHPTTRIDTQVELINRNHHTEAENSDQPHEGVSSSYYRNGVNADGRHSAEQRSQPNSIKKRGSVSHFQSCGLKHQMLYHQLAPQILNSSKRKSKASRRQEDSLRN